MLRLAGLLLAALVLAPGAAAFSSTPNELLIAYDVSATPVVVAAGELAIEGELTGGFFVGGATTTRLATVPHVAVLEGDGTSVVRKEWIDTTIEVSSGGLLWRFEEGALAIDASAPYAVGLALPQAPLPSSEGIPPSGFLIAGEGLAGSARWSGGALELVPVDAVITLRDARGQPLAEWDARRVNTDPEGLSGAEARTRDVAFRLEGAFDARLGSSILGGATGDATALALSVSRAEDDRFSETVALLQATSAQLGQQGGSADAQNPLELLERMSGLLNGALLVVGGDGTTPEAEPLASTWGTQEFAVGAFNLLRGDDLALAWTDGEMRVEGEPTVALGREGFAVDPPARLGIFPVVSVILWIAAIASIVWWIVARPPKAKSELTYRLLSFLAWALVLALTFFLWDRSFTQTFGTGVLAVAKAEGVGPGTLPQLGVLLALELVPWGIAALLFALPVRIAAGVALQRLGKGKSFKGLASAAGLISLAVFGPIYALWCFNLVWARAASMLG